MNTTAASATSLRNGPGAAAVLAAGIGSFALGLLDVIADKIPSIKTWMNFYNPTGALSGVTTCAIFAWLAAWAIFEMRWRRRQVRFAPIGAAALVLLALGMLLTFPPLADLF
jgi:membrane associated rhomboid family serine protease